jgi:hypothetical protein
MQMNKHMDYRILRGAAENSGKAVKGCDITSGKSILTSFPRVLIFLIGHRKKEKPQV